MSQSGSFLRWLGSFIRSRKTKTNIPEASTEINESSNAEDELEKNGYGSDECEDVGFDAMTVTPSHLQRSRNQFHQKNVRNIQAAVKEKSVPLEKVNQTEITGAELDVTRDTSKVLRKRMTSMNDERQDDEDDLFGKLVAAELKSLPWRQKYRLKHEINNLAFNYKLQNENDVTHSVRRAGRIRSPTFHSEAQRTFHDVNHSGRGASRIQSPTFHSEAYRSFHNAGHWYNV